MNRDTRDKFVSGTQADKTSGNAVWETAPEVFAKLNKDFGPFDVDLTADPNRSLCDVWFGPGHPLDNCRDALTANWADYGNCGFSNPPYGDFIPKILAVAIEQAQRGFASTFLLPLRVTRAFRQFVLRSPRGVATELLFCDRRLVFYEDGAPRYSLNKKTGKLNTQPDTALFDSIIVRYMPYAAPLRVGEWQVPEHGKVRRNKTAA